MRPEAGAKPGRNEASRAAPPRCSSFLRETPCSLFVISTSTAALITHMNLECVTEQLSQVVSLRHFSFRYNPFPFLCKVAIPLGNCHSTAAASGYGRGRNALAAPGCTGGTQLAAKEICGRGIGANPIAAKQEVVDLVGKDQFLEVDFLIAQSL